VHCRSKYIIFVHHILISTKNPSSESMDCNDGMFLVPVSAGCCSAPTLTVHALNANGFISPAKIHHVNNVFCSRHPHVFVISEIKMSAKMGSKFSSLGYNVYEETGICCSNHHISKWGIILGVQSDIQVSQPVKISSASLIGRVVAVDIILGTTAGKGFIHRIIGAYGILVWMTVTSGCRWPRYARACNIPGPLLVI
jgi:hypothetical protein